MFVVELSWWLTVLSILFLLYKTYGTWQEFFVPAQTLIEVKLLVVTGDIPGGTLGYPAQPGLIHSVCPSIRQSGPLCICDLHHKWLILIICILFLC
jgi:hypothetical protein